VVPHDASETFVVVEDEEGMDIPASDSFYRDIDGLAGADRLECAAHDLAGGFARVELGGKFLRAVSARDSHEVSAADHSDRPIVLDDWDVMATLIDEQPPDFIESTVRSGRADMARHYFRNEWAAADRHHWSLSASRRH
jgi:hypothetical protein